MQAGGTEPWQHRTVLLHEAVDSLVTTADGVYLDGTFGRGGHSRLILSRLSPRGRLLAIDRDPEAVAHARSGPQAIVDPRFSIAHTSFAHLADAVRAQGVSHVDGVLLDIGVSSPQIDNPERGFSFRFDAPLDMRMDTTRGETAADFLAGNALSSDRGRVARLGSSRSVTACLCRRRCGRVCRRGRVSGSTPAEPSELF